MARQVTLHDMGIGSFAAVASANCPWRAESGSKVWQGQVSNLPVW